ncbi:MAG: hypothetical protein U0401_27920 [Anaerolineae bacterium]
MMPSISNDPALPGYTYGFAERFDNSRRTLMHGGNLRDAASLAVIMPPEQVGFFVSFNTPIEISSGSDLEKIFTESSTITIPKRSSPKKIS